MTVLRLLTYNVRSLRDDAAAVARVIRGAQPHLVCVQEAPRLLRWRSRCAALARRSGLVVVAGGRTAAGNLLLCSLSVEVDATREVRFPRIGRTHVRGAAIATLRLAGSRFAVAGIHLDLTEPPRLQHVAQLHALLDQEVPDAVPIVVAGDINDRPGSAVWAALSARGSDAWAAAGGGDGFTFSATRPYERIDAVFGDQRLAARAAQVLGGADVRVASDHRPLLVEFELPG